MTDDDRGLPDPYGVDEETREPSPTVALYDREAVDRDADLSVLGAIGYEVDGEHEHPEVEVTISFDGGTVRLTLDAAEVRHLRAELDAALTEAERLVEEDRDAR